MFGKAALKQIFGLFNSTWKILVKTKMFIVGLKILSSFITHPTQSSQVKQTYYSMFMMTFMISLFSN